VEAGLRKYRVVFVCGALIWPTSHTDAAQNAVAQAVQRLHLSPQQLLSLRDFLGPFNRGTDVDAAEDGRFILRDAATMAYAGEFWLRVGSGGRLEVDRIGGPARLDPARTVPVSLRLTDKVRAQIVAALANSQAAKPDGPVTAERIERVEPPPAPPSVSVAAAQLTDASARTTLSQSRAQFWPDGSGWSVSVRLQSGAPTARMTERFLAPVQADGAQVWRARVVEISGDMKFALADFETRYPCTANAACVPRYIPAESGLHVIRWNRTLISAVPPSLMAQIAGPPPTSPVAQAPAPESMNNDGADAQLGTPSPAPSVQSAPGNPGGL
jgi:hypothetical protein